MLIAESFTDIDLTQCKLQSSVLCDAELPSSHINGRLFLLDAVFFLARELSIVFVNTSFIEVENTPS